MYKPHRFNPIMAAFAGALLSASAFDPDLFMNTTVSTVLPTKMVPVPPGEYTAIIDDVKTRQNTDGSVVMDVSWSIDNADVAAKTGRTKNVVRQSIWLDFENGVLAASEGKNVGLGRLRDALGQNTGAPWSPTMLKGGVAKVKVVPNINKDTGEDYGKVVAATKLA